MRKALTIIGLIMSISVLVYLVNGIIQKMNDREEIEEKMRILPSFSFTDLEGKSFSSDNIREGPVLIVKFHPECEHCQYELSEIFNSIIPKTGIKILLITNSEKEKTARFLSAYEITYWENVNVLIDTAAVFREIFGRDLVPSNYIYNRDLQLVKALYGEQKIESIMNFLGLNE